MAASIQPPSQYKQPSRKGKKAWRKNVDLTEVQEGLETVRDEVIRGGVIAERPSHELFTTDVTPDLHIKRAYQKDHKLLKADEILARRSAIPAIDSRKRPAPGTTDGILVTKRKRTGAVSRAELERLRRVAAGEEGGALTDATKAPDAPDFDPWAEDQTTAMIDLGPTDPAFSFLTPPQPIKEPKTLKHAPISLAANGKDIPAVKRPAPEASYNPHAATYFSAFMREGSKEIEAEKRRVREAAEERERLAMIAAAVAEEEAKAQAGGDDANDSAEDESEWEGIQSEGEGGVGPEWLSRRRPERKTQAQRNKIKRRREAERLARWEAQLKRRRQQAAEIESIARAVEAKERSRALSVTKHGPHGNSDDGEESDGDASVLRRRRLGKHFVPEPPLELVLPSELQDSLRRLRPEGNLLRDRFRSMLVRGRMETRKPIQQPKRAKRMATEKWSYKDWKLKP